MNAAGGRTAGRHAAVVVVNPRQVREFARGMGQWAKTDPIDARILATFAQIVNPTPKHTLPRKRKP
jgi:transposase